MLKTAILILAAGQSNRFNGCKLLASAKDPNIDSNKPLLQHVIDKAHRCLNHSGNLKDLYVVSGRWHQQLQTAIADTELADVPLLYNPDWEQGMGHSIAHGVAQLQHRYDRILIIAGDQIAVTAEDLQKLLNQDDSKMAAAFYNNAPGIPALFPKSFFDELMALKGDRGAKKILMQQPVQTVLVDMPNAIIDIDRPEDLNVWQEQF